jgi:hypothetical protein
MTAVGPTRTFAGALSIALCVLVAAGGGSARADPEPQYTVGPATQPYMLPETEGGVLDFVITDKLPFNLIIGGYTPIIQFLFGDRTDDFSHVILGPGTPYLLTPDVPQTVPVLIIPDLEMDDSPLDSGHWSFDLGPQVLVAPHLPAFGSETAAEIIIYDVAEPSTASIMFGAVLGVGLLTSTRLRISRPRTRHPSLSLADPCPPERGGDLP